MKNLLKAPISLIFIISFFYFSSCSKQDSPEPLINGSVIPPTSFSNNVAGPENYIYVKNPGRNRDIAPNLQAAYDTAKEGDVLVLPEGTFKYSGAMSMYKIVSLMGAGKDKTILYRDNTVADASTGDYMFEYNINRDTSSHFIFKGITLRSKKPAALDNTGGSLKIDIGLQLTGMLDFVITDSKFENFGYAGVTIYHDALLARGLIYNCNFNHNFKGNNLGYGYGIAIHSNNSQWVPTVGFGSNNFIFVEDNIFDSHFQAINSNNASKAVIRYNYITNNWMDAAISVHESYGPPNYPGRAIEVYNNTINANKFYAGANRGQDIVPGHSIDDLMGVAISPKGGDALIYNNTISGYRYLTHVAAFPNSFNDIAYPLHYAVGYSSGLIYGALDRSIDHGDGDLFIWGNTLTTYLGYTPLLFDNWDPTWFIEDRDYHFVAKPGYTPYTYPHPLRSEYEN